MTTETADFKDGPLHKTLVNFLPIYVRDPFSGEPTIDVQKLRKAMNKSHEAVYKWLRASKLTSENTRELIELANTAENVAVLSKLGRTPPTVEDFLPFFFRA